MRFPETLKYTKDHEWGEADAKSIKIGITDHAQKALGDIVYVELPELGRNLKQGEIFGVVESIKAVSDLYAPVSGKIIAVNSELLTNPAKINQDAHGSGWIIKVEPVDSDQFQGLMDASSYTKYVESMKA